MLFSVWHPTPWVHLEHYNFNGNFTKFLFTFILISRNFYLHLFWFHEIFIYIYFNFTKFWFTFILISRNFYFFLGGIDLSWRNRKSSWYCLSDIETSSRIAGRNRTESFYIYLGWYTFWNLWIRICKLFRQHNLQFQGLCLMKMSKKMIQNFPYFWN